MDPLSTSEQIGRMLRRGNWGHIYNNNYRVNWLLHNSAGGELMVGSSGLCAGAAKTWSSPATWKKSKKKATCNPVQIVVRLAEITCV